MSSFIYGIHSVEEALKSAQTQLEKIFVVTEDPSLRLKTLLNSAHQKQVPIVSTTREELDRRTQGGFHQDVAGLVRRHAYARLEEVLGRQKEGKTKGLLLILDSLQDPQNFGSLIRTALGFGAQGIVVPRDRAVGITPVVIRASAGATAHLPVVQVINIARTIDALKKRGFWVYGAAAEAKDPVFELDLTTDLALVIGSEGSGVRPLVKKRCDRLFSIPMVGPVSSFNAAVSGGVILYEVMRQRRIHDSGQMR